MIDDILVTMNGIPIITRSDLEKEKERVLKANPQLQRAIAFMDPKELNRNLLEGMVGQKVIDEYIIANKINETDEYRTTLQELCEERRQFLNAKYFSERNAITVSEAEIKNFYEKNKDKYFNKSQDQMIESGGSQYISYETIKEKLKKELEDQKQAEMIHKEIDEFKKKYDIHVNEDLLK